VDSSIEAVHVAVKDAPEGRVWHSFILRFVYSHVKCMFIDASVQ